MIVVGPMPLKDQKMLKVIFKLSPLRCSRATYEDDHEFLTTCYKLVCTSGMVELRGFEFPT